MNLSVRCLVLFSLLSVAPVTSAEDVKPADAPKTAGSEVPTPERTKFVMPSFPPEALARGIPALVVVELVIDESGKVAEAKVLHGAEPFAQAALDAVRQWEYKPTRLDGRPVRVRHTLPINFAVKLPEMKRDSGVPELRQGVAPATPAAARGRSGSVVAHLEVASDGRISEAIVKSGESPWSESLLEAVKTWRFATSEDGSRVSFDVHADYRDGRVALDLKDPKRLAADAAPTAAPTEAPREASATPAPALPAPIDGLPVSVETRKDDPEATPTAPPKAPAASAPPVEVVSTQPTRAEAPPAANAPPTPPPPVENGLSSVRDVELTAGIPDLVRGRRPVSPPLARLGQLEGDVEVRFSIDSGGATSIHSVNGREELKEAAESLVRTWSFRRTAPQRLFALAEIHYGMNGSRARIRLVP
jgi:TonB family protein